MVIRLLGFLEVVCLLSRESDPHIILYLQLGFVGELQYGIFLARQRGGPLKCVMYLLRANAVTVKFLCGPRYAYYQSYSEFY